VPFEVNQITLIAAALLYVALLLTRTGGGNSFFIAVGLAHAKVIHTFFSSFAAGKFMSLFIDCNAFYDFSQLSI